MRTALALALAFLLAGCAGPRSARPLRPVRWDAATCRETPPYRFLDRAARRPRAARRLYFESVAYRGRTTRVFAYLALPEAGRGKAPGVVLVHGGGASASRAWAERWAARGYAAISMDLCGAIPGDEYGAAAPRRHPVGGPSGEGLFADVAEPVLDQWPYHAVAAALRARTLLASLPEVDARRVGVVGCDLGAVFACLAASSSDRWAFAVAAGGCGFLEEDSDRLEAARRDGRSAEFRAWCALWDPARYLADARCPFLWLAGEDDPTFPPSSVMRSAAAAGGPAGRLAFRSRPPRRADALDGRLPEAEAFADGATGLGPAYPRCVSATARGRRAEAVFDLEGREESMVEFAWLAPAPGDGARRWRTCPVDLAGGKAAAEIPKGASAWFFSVFCREGEAVSSPITSRDGPTVGRRGPAIRKIGGERQ